MSSMVSTIGTNTGPGCRPASMDARRLPELLLLPVALVLLLLIETVWAWPPGILAAVASSAAGSPSFAEALWFALLVPDFSACALPEALPRRGFKAAS